MLANPEIPTDRRLAITSGVTAPSIGGDRNIDLDAVRGVAAIVVIFYHSILGLDPSLIDGVLKAPLFKIHETRDLVIKLVLMVFNGDLAVTMFFVLSGAVLFESLDRSKGSARTVALGFLIKRLFRIFPMLLVSLLFCCSTYWLAGFSFGVNDVVENALLYDTPLIGATWTLNVELFGTFFILACFGAYKVGGQILMAVAGLAICAALKIPVLHGILQFFRGHETAFLFGMLIPTRAGSIVSARLPCWTWIVFLGIAVVARHLAPHSGRTVSLVQEGAIALLLGLLYHQRATIRVLSQEARGVLGRCSYSLYLLNPPILTVAVTVILRHQPSGVGQGFLPLVAGVPLGAAITLLCLPLAVLSYNCVERPGIRVGAEISRRLLARRPERLPSMAERRGKPSALLTDPNQPAGFG